MIVNGKSYFFRIEQIAGIACKYTCEAMGALEQRIEAMRLEKAKGRIIQ
jgi:hypothetical protein